LIREQLQAQAVLLVLEAEARAEAGAEVGAKVGAVAHNKLEVEVEVDHHQGTTIMRWIGSFSFQTFVYHHLS
jgi:hypothetical protein